MGCNDQQYLPDERSRHRGVRYINASVRHWSTDEPIDTLNKAKNAAHTGGVLRNTVKTRLYGLDALNLRNLFLQHTLDTVRESDL